MYFNEFIGQILLGAYAYCTVMVYMLLPTILLLSGVRNHFRCSTNPVSES